MKDRIGAGGGFVKDRTGVEVGLFDIKVDYDGILWGFAVCFLV